MINPYIKCLKSEKAESGILYGQFLISGLNVGQGITIGNLLRRVLLGDLGGVCITAIRIPGIKDEFSIVTGVREDILEILLNLKGIILKGEKIDTQYGRLKIQGPAIITADLIQVPSNLEVINPNHYIATISTKQFLEMEFKFEYGTGYKLANHTFDDKFSDFLQIDAVFMPIQKVNFKIEQVYEDSNNINERLLVEIWTNGSITPIDAIKQAAEFISGFFISIVENKFPNERKNNNSESITILRDPYNNIAIEELQLSVRAYNCLKRAKINTIADLLDYSPEKLQELNFGRKSADEVFIKLKNKLGIILK
jgi:DNA-directed RNA polymerase subunit alpha